MRDLLEERARRTASTAVLCVTLIEEGRNVIKSVVSVHISICLFGNQVFVEEEIINEKNIIEQNSPLSWL